MKSKTRRAKRGPTLQTIDLVEITDPAEIAALEERIRKAEVALAAAALKSAQATLVKKRPRNRSVPPAA